MQFLTIPQPASMIAMAALLACSAAGVQSQATPKANPAPGASATAKSRAHAITPARKHAHAHKKPGPAQPAPPTTAQVTVPAAPPPPNWPANDTPAAASITWDSQGLRIVANNSSLDQILREVSTVTGTKIEGYAADQRVFGAYGPGSERAVLFQLLDGSGYNVLMIGDLGPGTPRQVVLSGAPNGPMPPVRNTPAEEEPAAEIEAQQPEPQPAPAQPEPAPNGYTPGMPVRTPQQMMQEMEQRRQQILQMEQQQQQQQNNPPQN